MDRLSSGTGAYSHLARLLEAGQPAALATVISGPLAGAKLIVPGAGDPVGTIHPALDAQVIQVAREMLVSERNETREYDLSGEELAVFIEVFPPPHRLVIIGAVHVAIPLHRIAKMLGYQVTVVDPRAAFANRERFTEADEILVEWPDEALARLKPDASTAVVVLTHDRKLDIPALMAALRSPAPYIGAIGSRTTSRERAQLLQAEGAGESDITRIHAPIGLNIGSQTPSEIALSIMAEIVAVRRGRVKRDA
jgi:xanthine dehydrogenase accessory factor